MSAAGGSRERERWIISDRQNGQISNDQQCDKGRRGTHTNPDGNTLAIQVQIH